MASDRYGDILFVHNNFPAQFGFLAEDLVARGYVCHAIGAHTAKKVEGVELWAWKAGRGSTPNIFDPATRAEADLIRGRAAANCALALKDRGYQPRLIIGHPGWGETLFLREIFPKTPQILYAEFYYGTEGGDSGFDLEFDPLSWDSRFRVLAKNATLGLGYLDADRIVSPTDFQRSRLPQVFASRTSVIHEGVDVDRIQPRKGRGVTLADGRVLDGSTPVITYVSRTLEPLRGFHVLMRAIPEVLRAIPNAEVVIIGEWARQGYGPPPPKDQTWKDVMLAEVGSRIDPNRVHFLGNVPHETMLDALSISAGHVYFTYPFVLSWSLLEAMGSGCLVIASDTAPVRDAITNGRDGVLLDFFDVKGLSETLIQACQRPEKFAALRANARRTIIKRFHRKDVCLSAWRRLIDKTIVRA
jgi:glycosyltransferase involved in cell wall biosynthesis